jgi:hypothetical protein
MQPTERAEFVRVLNGMAAIRRVDLTAEAISLWWAAMARWTLEDFKAAASHLIGATEFMPTPFDFNQLRRAGEPTPSEAWTKAVAECRHWRNPELLPNGRIARAAAAVGGFRNIAMCNIETDLPHVQRRFLEAYEELSDVDQVREALPQIAGSPDQPRIRGGFQRITDVEIDP